MATVDAPVADTDRMHIVLGLGALEGYPVIFEKERLSVEDVLAGMAMLSTRGCDVRDLKKCTRWTW